MEFSASLGQFCPLAPFSDQSHLQFYAPSRRPFANCHARRFLPRLQAVCVPITQPAETSYQQNWWKELADLEADLKQTKTQLKDQIKEKKKQLKDQMKVQKRAVKEQKRKMTKDKGCSSSSSSSESSEGECESVEMNCLRGLQEKPTESKACIPVLPSAVQEISPQYMDNKLGDDSVNVSDQTGSNSSQLQFSCPSAEISTEAEKIELSKEAGKIEVCVGGKCKKAGSEQLLASLRAQIPGDSAVAAVPCKCMGKCKMSINVKVQKQETNPQHHSHVGVGDAGLLLSHHFDLGPLPTGLPRFGQQAMPCLVPELLTVAT